MTNILTENEAANALRCEVDDENMLDLLPLVDAYIERATGRDWTGDTTIEPLAKSAARILLVRLHEDPGAMGASTLGWGFQAALTQLEAKALELEVTGAPDEVLALERHNMHTEMVITANLVLVFNHELAATATTYVTLEDSAGNTVAITNSLDATSTIITVNPDASLTAASTYTLVLDHVPDIYGQTLDTEIIFSTA